MVVPEKLWHLVPYETEAMVSVQGALCGFMNLQYEQYRSNPNNVFIGGVAFAARCVQRLKAKHNGDAFTTAVLLYNAFNSMFPRLYGWYTPEQLQKLYTTTQLQDYVIAHQAPPARQQRAVTLPHTFLAWPMCSWVPVIAWNYSAGCNLLLVEPQSHSLFFLFEWACYVYGFYSTGMLSTEQAIEFAEHYGSHILTQEYLEILAGLVYCVPDSTYDEGRALELYKKGSRVPQYMVSTSAWPMFKRHNMMVTSAKSIAVVRTMNTVLRASLQAILPKPAYQLPIASPAPPAIRNPVGNNAPATPSPPTAPGAVAPADGGDTAVGVITQVQAPAAFAKDVTKKLADSPSAAASSTTPVLLDAKSVAIPPSIEIFVNTGSQRILPGHGLLYVDKLGLFVPPTRVRTPDENSSAVLNMFRTIYRLEPSGAEITQYKLKLTTKTDARQAWQLSTEELWKTHFDSLWITIRQERRTQDQLISELTNIPLPLAFDGLSGRIYKRGREGLFRVKCMTTFVYSTGIGQTLEFRPVDTKNTKAIAKTRAWAIDPYELMFNDYGSSETFTVANASSYKLPSGGSGSLKGYLQYWEPPSCYVEDSLLGVAVLVLAKAAPANKHLHLNALTKVPNVKRFIDTRKTLMSKAPGCVTKIKSLPWEGVDAIDDATTIAVIARDGSAGAFVKQGTKWFFVTDPDTLPHKMVAQDSAKLSGWASKRDTCLVSQQIVDEWWGT